MLLLGIIIGAVGSFILMCLFIAGEDETDARQIYKDGARDFAQKLKTKRQKPEYPGEFYISESDIDEVLKEMESEY